MDKKVAETDNREELLSLLREAKEIAREGAAECEAMISMLGTDREVRNAP